MKRTSLLTAVLLAAAPVTAHAGGMFLHTRGVRPTARGGAFVAGADDAGAMWFNPAGLAAMAGGAHGTSILFDTAYVTQDGSYARVDSGGNPDPDAPVENQASGLPVPSLAGAWDLGDDGVIAAGVWAPYAGLMKFGEQDAQRYSLVDMSASAIVTVGVGVGWKFGKLRVGATVQNWVASMVQQMVVSGCPGETVCMPEDPDWDALVELEQRDLFNPSASLGVQYDAARAVGLGLAFQAPIKMAGGATLRTRLPRSGFYDGASVSGDQADLEFWLPASLRAGLEVRLGGDAKAPPLWRIEAAVDYEMWSMHDEMRITPDDMRIENAPGVGTYDLGPMAVPRNFEDTIAASLGIEGQPSAGLPLRVLAGYTYETRAAQDAYLSVLTFDGAKHVLGGGLGYSAGRFSIDAVVSYGAVEDRDVSMEEARSPQLTPVRDPSAEPLVTYVNAGTYQTSWFLAGVGLRAGF